MTCIRQCQNHLQCTEAEKYQRSIPKANVGQSRRESSSTKSCFHVRTMWELFVNEKHTNLSFFRLSSLATMLNLRQKSSPFSPREGRSVSSEFPLIMGFRGVATPSLNAMLVGVGLFDAGRMNAGVIGVTGGSSGWGVDGAGEAGARPGPAKGGSKGFWILIGGGIPPCLPPGAAAASGRARFRAAIGAA